MTDKAPDPTVSTGASTLVDALRDAASRGYAGQFVARDDGTVECTACTTASPADAVDVDATERLEGASDAADMLMVAWVRCPECATKGVITLGFGPNASEADAAVLPLLPTDTASVGTAEEVQTVTRSRPDDD